MALRASRDELTWFEQVSPALLRNKAIRNYLAQYTAGEWPEVVKLTLLYGILTLHRHYPAKPFSLPQLRDLLATGQVTATVEAALPDVSNQLDKLQGQILDIAGDVYHPAAKVLHTPKDYASAQQQEPAHTTTVTLAQGVAEQPQPLAATPPAPQVVVPPVVARQSHPLPAAARVRRLSNPVIAAMPPAGWRAGDDIRTWSPPGKKRSPGRARSPDGAPAPAGAVYPAWWGDGSDDPPPAPAAPAPARPARPNPRLAYSVQPDYVPLYEDDLVTSRYLQVPGSGYAHQDEDDYYHMAAPPLGPYGPPAVGPPAPPIQPPSLAPGLHPFAAPQPQAGPPKPQPPQPAQAQQQVLYALHPSGVMMPIMMSPNTQQQGEPQQRQDKKRASKKLNLSAVESRIKAQVAADKAQAKQRYQARQRAIINVFKAAEGYPPLRETLLHPVPRLPSPPPPPPPASTSIPPSHNTPSRHLPSTHRPYAPHQASPSTPSDLADNLATNPWTSWFMGSPHPTYAPPPPPPYPSATGQYPPGPLPPPPPAGAYPMMSAGGLWYPYVQGQPQPIVPQGYGAPMAWPPGAPPHPHPTQPPPGWLDPTGGLGSGGGAEPPPPGVDTPVHSSAAAGGGGGGGGEASAQVVGSVPPPHASDVVVIGAHRRPAGLKWELDEMTLQSIVQAQAQSKANRPGDAPATGVRDEVKKWSKSWVGDFGHMNREPRFDFSQPFQLNKEQTPDPAREEELSSFQAEVEELKAKMAQARLDGLVAASEDLMLSEAQARLDAALAAIPPPSGAGGGRVEGPSNASNTPMAIHATGGEASSASAASSSAVGPTGGAVRDVTLAATMSAGGAAASTTGLAEGEEEVDPTSATLSPQLQTLFRSQFDA